MGGGGEKMAGRGWWQQNGCVVDGRGWSWMVAQFSNTLYELNKRVNTEAIAHGCSVVVSKNQKQPLADILQKRCS